MERLTNHFDYCKMIDCKFYDAELYKQGKCKFFDKSIEHCHEKRMNDKLREYEDAEEQGLLVRLPCKVGDTIYKIWYKPCHHGEDHPDSYGCCGCEDDCDLEKTIFEFVVPGLEWVLNHFNVFGNYIWFLTKAEAEAALAEMNKKENINE